MSSISVVVAENAVDQIYWLLVSAFWGTLRLFELRSSRSQGEDNWTFGQIVPCALFLAPVLALLDAVAKIWKEDKTPPPSRRAGKKVSSFPAHLNATGKKQTMLTVAHRRRPSHTTQSISPLVRTPGELTEVVQR